LARLLKILHRRALRVLATPAMLRLGSPLGAGKGMPLRPERRLEPVLMGMPLGPVLVAMPLGPETGLEWGLELSLEHVAGLREEHNGAHLHAL
jgi:hypothetical protein